MATYTQDVTEFTYCACEVSYPLKNVKLWDEVVSPLKDVLLLFGRSPLKWFNQFTAFYPISMLLVFALTPKWALLLLWPR